MDIKTDVQNFVHLRIKNIASDILTKRALSVIEEASNERESLLIAADKVSKIISLFLDKDLGNELFGSLKAKIDRVFP